VTSADHPKSGHKLLERTKRARSGWGQRHFKRLYAAFGFVGHERAKHVLYDHPEHPDLVGSVPRHDSLRDWVANDAIALIDELLKREGEPS